ncbi:MAG: 6,7-dimethyl-8-ribityllumazine synthase [Saprospiraceae bacterium]|nr:6,7-dimethyl-8-ribityllumazine synthase [Saprospiraceae bacterium]
MSTADRNLSDYDRSNLPDISALKFGIVVSKWNAEITNALKDGCVDTLKGHGASDENIFIVQVPGSFELPAGARMIDDKYNLDAVICLGCVIKGETSHNEYINQAVATGLVQLGIARSKPYIFGILTPDNQKQARDRAGGKHGNKGVEAAVAAIEMATLKKELQNSKKKIGF